MTKQEFLKKYAYAPSSASDFHQITWDLIEGMEETFGNDDIGLETMVNATYYDVSVLLEVMRKDISDYKFLKQMKEDLKSIEA